VRAIVTGANRGIGKAVAAALLQEGWEVTLAVRDVASGLEAAAEIGGGEVHPLDLSYPESVTRFAAERGPVDLLVNNAAVSLAGFTPRVVEWTILVNLYAQMELTDRLAWRMGPGARVVNVSSGLAELSAYSPRLRARFLDPKLDRAGLRSLMAEYVAAVHRGDWQDRGWPTSAYAVSKTGLNAYTRLLARERPEWRVNAVCPGWVRTRMGGDGAPRSIEEGAASVLWGAHVPPDGPTGGFFRDQKALSD
jgi:NAD(P)-dependent dehydrogenase (short-subunit alcohol dehydrogenase family)